MGRFVAVIATCLSLVLLPGAPVASAEPDIQPVGSVPVPEGPAPAWIVADMDTGQVLAGRDMDVARADCVLRRGPLDRHTNTC